MITGPGCWEPAVYVFEIFVVAVVQMLYAILEQKVVFVGK
jgi:hypothetical protein